MGCALVVAIVVCRPLVAHAQPSASGGLAKDLQQDLAALASAASAGRVVASPSAVLSARQLLERIRATDLLIQERQRSIDERLQRAKAPAAPLQRQLEHTRLFRERMDRLYHAGEPLSAETPPTDAQLRAAFAAIVEALRDAIDTESRTPIGAILPYRSLAWPQVAPQSGAVVTPAYLTTPVVAPQAADLAETTDTQFTDAIRAKAAALSRDSIAIFEFVQNSVQSEFYYGAMKDASDTLRQLSGNDTDQASLLIAMLRASQVPARYVRGVIRLTGPQAVAWTGTGSTRRAAEIFTRAGIPFRPILQGGSIAAFEIEHTWVEAYVPYSNYRGVRLGTIGRAWIPLDPSFKAVDVAAGEDVLAAMGFTAGTLVTSYLSQTQALAPMDFYRNAITTYLAQTGSPLTFDDVLSTRTTRANLTGLLPSTLPYSVVSIHGEFPELPASLRHRVRFVAEGEGGLSFDVTIPAAELAGRRLTLSYIPATVEDQAVVHSFLGLDNTPAYLVKLRPVLKVGGVVKAAGATPVQMGGFHSLTVEIQTPRGAVPVVNSMLAGGYYALGLATQPAAYEIPLARPPDDTEHPAADRLYSIAIDYIRRWNDAEQTLERLLRVVNVRPALSHVIVGTVHARTAVFGQPQAIEWRGVFVDADLRVAEPVPTGSDDTRAPEFMRLSGLAGSVLEADVLRSNLNVDAVSAASVIHLAREGAIVVEDVTAANLADVLARLQTADVVKSEIADAVNQGWRVTIPQRDLTSGIWAGIGYVMIDPSTGAGGYFISGGLAGGSTTQTPEEWADEALAEELATPYSGEPNTDPAAAFTIEKVSITDKQNGIVGQSLEHPLAVWVRDRDGIPVRAAVVTFTSEIGGGTFGAHQTITAVTNHLGIARAELTLGRSTSELPFYVLANPDDAYPTQVGQNIVTATIAGSDGIKSLPAPFQHFAFPGAAHHLTKLQGEGNLAPIGTAAGTVRVRVADEYENPISNAAVTFAAAPFPPQPLPPNAANITLFPTHPPCAIPMPTANQCGAVPSVEIVSGPFGAAADTILGNTTATTYHVRASVMDLPPAIFSLRSSGQAFDPAVPHHPTVLLSLLHLSNSAGTRIDATKVGTTYARPLGVGLYLFEPNYVVEPTNIPGCESSDDPCFRVRQTGTHRTRTIDMHRDGPAIEYAQASPIIVAVPKSTETASVRFTIAEGAGSTDPQIPASNPGNGQYFTTFSAGDQPRLNLIEVNAQATVWIPRFNLDTGQVIPELVSGVLAGSSVTFNTSQNPPLPVISGGPTPVTHRVFGVRGTVPSPFTHVTADGITAETKALRYTIEPPSYTAATASIDLFRTEQNGDEMWLGFIPGNQLSGDQGTATLLQGVALEIERLHQVQLVLNRGTDAEIRSEKHTLRLLTPGLVGSPGTRLTTYLDRANQTTCEVAGSLPLLLGRDATVTILVNGVPFTDANGVLYLNREMLASARNPETGALIPHLLPVNPLLVSAPGAHDVTITAIFDEPDPIADLTVNALTSIVHDVVINAFLPIGHTIVKGVDVADGHFSLSREDLAIPSVGPALTFIRSYTTAGHKSSGVMGAGWVHNYEARILRDPCGVVTLVGGEGSGIKFTPVSPSEFRPQAGYHGRLTFDGATNSYDFYTKLGARHHYESAPDAESGAVHRLAFTEDSNGNRLSLTYDPAPPFNLQTVTDASGRVLTFTYELVGQLPQLPQPRVRSVTGPLGLTVNYAYDSHGNLTNATRADRSETYEYAIGNVRDRHNIVRIVGPNHGVTGAGTDVMVLTYFSDADTIPGEDPDAQLFPEKWEFVRTLTAGAGTPDAATHQFRYDYSNAQRLRTTVIDPRHVQTDYVIDRHFGAVVETRITTATGVHVTTTEWAFQSGINDVYITAATDANGRRTSFTYDANGNPTSETVHADTVGYALPTNAAGTPTAQVITRKTYHPLLGRVTREVDAEGRVTDFELDSAGNVSTVTTYPGGSVAPVVNGYTYFNANGLRGLVRTSVDPRGRVTLYETYDVFGNPTRITDPEGTVTTYVYDARGRRREMHDSRGHSAIFEYDELDRSTVVRQLTGAQPVDLAMASVDRQTTTTYFPGGQTRTSTSGTGHTTTYAYDALNREVLREDVVQNADGASETLRIESAFDGNGNKIREIDRRQIVHLTSYDDLNRVIESRTNNQLVGTRTYDAAGNRRTETDLHGHVTTYEFDGLYREIRTILPIPSFATAKRYDLVGNVIESIDANGRSLVNTYDGLDRLTSTTDALGRIKRIEHDPAGNRVLEHDLATGLRVHFEDYDGVNRPRRMRQEFNDPVTGGAVVYTTTHEYLDSENARLTINPRGVVTRERFNGHDALIERVVDPSGLALTTTFRYDGNGNLTGTKDSEGSVIDEATVYDGLNRRVRTIYPLGGEARWFYDGNSNVVRTIDRRGVQRASAFDALNRKISDSVVESISNAGTELTLTSIDYDDAGNATIVTDANGGTTTQFDDPLHRPIRIVDALNQQSLNEWDGVNRIAQVDKRGIRTEFRYDVLDRLIETRRLTETGAQVISTEYLDASGRRIEIEPAVTTIVQFDPLQRLRRTSKRHAGLAAPYGAEEFVVEEREYDGVGNLVQAVDAAGHRTGYEYDTANRHIRLIEGVGSPVEASTTMTYDRAGNLLTAKDGRPTGRAYDTRFTYDVRNRRVLAENGAGSVTAFQYDQNDVVRLITEPRGATTSYTYDELGKVLTVDETRGGVGGITRYRYDRSRNLVAQQDAAGNLTTWRYDAMHRVTDSFQHTVPGAMANEQSRSASVGGDEATALRWHYEFDANGNQILIVDAEGQRVLRTYDQLDRLVRKTFENHRPGPDGSTILPQALNITYRYDASGNTRQVDALKRTEAGTVTRTTVMDYDPLDRLTSTTNPDGKTLRFEYDRSGNQTAMVDADERRTTYTYDARQRLASAVDAGGTAAYEYWPDNLQRSVTYPNGAVAEMTYDSADRLIAIVNHGGNASQPISRFTYTYDANGNRTAQVEQHARLNGGAAEHTTYRYDALNRLVGVDYPGAADMTYAYGVNGNRIAESGVQPVTHAPAARIYTYNRLNQLTTIADTANPTGSVALRYDRNGNTVEQKVGVLDGEGGDIPAPSAVKTYVWDIRDHLSRSDGAVGAVRFDYDFAGRRVQMASPVADIRYLHAGPGVVQEYDGSTQATTLRYTYGPSGVAAMDSGAAGRSFYMRDALGSTSELTDAAGETQASYSYDPWGKILVSFDTTSNRRRFGGHYTDTETGLQFFGARYYDETTGRFLSQDSYLGETDNPVSRHRYQFAFANPLRFNDPTGNTSEEANADFDVGNPCRGQPAPCNPATKAIDDTLNEINAAYEERIRREGQALADMVGHPGGPDPDDPSKHRRPTGMYKTRADAYRNIDTYYKEERAFTAQRRQEIAEQLGTEGDTLSVHLTLLLEETVERDPDMWVAAGFVETVAAITPGIAIADLGIKLKQDKQTTWFDWIGAAGDALSLLGPVAKATGGLRQALKTARPTAATTAGEADEILKLAQDRNIVIGIRATDAITARVTRVLNYFKVPAKPPTVEGKSLYGLAWGKRSDGFFGRLTGYGPYRSDLDIAYIRHATDDVMSAAGRPADNAATWVDKTTDARGGIGNEINRLTGTDSVKHGSAASAGPRYGGPKNWDSDSLGKIGPTGPVIEFGPNGTTARNAAWVNNYLLQHGAQHADWYAPAGSSIFQTGAGHLPYLTAKYQAQTWKDQNGK